LPRQSGWLELYRAAQPLVRMVVALPLPSAAAETDCPKSYESCFQRLRPVGMAGYSVYICYIAAKAPAETADRHGRAAK
jgi:hypothetical protein